MGLEVRHHHYEASWMTSGQTIQITESQLRDFYNSASVETLSDTMTVIDNSLTARPVFSAPRQTTSSISVPCADIGAISGEEALRSRTPSLPRRPRTIVRIRQDRNVALFDDNVCPSGWACNNSNCIQHHPSDKNVYQHQPVSRSLTETSLVIGSPPNSQHDNNPGNGEDENSLVNNCHELLPVRHASVPKCRLDDFMDSNDRYRALVEKIKGASPRARNSFWP